MQDNNMTLLNVCPRSAILKERKKQKQIVIRKLTKKKFHY